MANFLIGLAIGLLIWGSIELNKSIGRKKATKTGGTKSDRKEYDGRKHKHNSSEST